MNTIYRLGIGFISFISCNAIMALDFDATTGWANRVEIGSQVSGVITEVKVTAGQQVKKDDLLMQLDQRLFKAQYTRTRAQVVSDKEALDEAKRELDRALELYEQTILAQHELQMAKNAHKKARADYKKSLAENIHAKMNLEYSSINSPFDAIIIKVLRNKGESVNALTEIPLMIIIAEAGRMKATGSVSSDALSKIKTGQNATVTVNSKSYNGKVSAIGLEPLKGTNLYQVDVEFGTTELIRAGSKASVNL